VNRLIAIAAIVGMLVAAGAATAAKPPPKKPPPGGGPGTLSIARSPGVVVFGRAATISGRLTGIPAGNGGVAVTLEGAPYPYQVFATATAGSTAPNGDYQFLVRPSENTRYRATAATTPPTGSAEVDVLVKIRVSIRVRGSRITGSAAPPHDGRVVELQRRTSRGYRTVARRRLADAGDLRSRYGFTTRRDGVYRARVPGDGDHLTGISGARRVA
jgi:hypothetical protein